MNLDNRSRRGYALLWAIIMIAVLATVMATVAPVLASVADQQRVRQSIVTLNALDTGIIRFGLVVKRVGGVYPSALHQLTTPVTATEQVSCRNNTMNTNAINTWVAGGPFVAFLSPPTGVVTPIGTIDDAIPTRAQNGALLLDMPNVDANLASMLDDIVDGSPTNPGTTGRILFGAASGTGTVTVQYSVGLQTGFLRANQC